MNKKDVNYLPVIGNGILAITKEGVSLGLVLTTKERNDAEKFFDIRPVDERTTATPEEVPV